MTGPVLKVAVLAVLGALCALLLKKSNGEMTVLLSLAVCVAAVTAVAALFKPVLETMEQARLLTGLSSAFFSPLLKCVGLGLTARMAADLCRDAGQGAMASAVELSGAVGALYAALPLFNTLLDTLEELL